MKKRKKILLITLCVIATLFSCLKIYYAIRNCKFDHKTIGNTTDENMGFALENIVTELGACQGDEIIVINSVSKRYLANSFISALAKKEIKYIQFNPTANTDSLQILKSLIEEQNRHRFFVFFISHEDAGFLFEYTGRPDQGLKIPAKYLFSDWLMPEDVFIRIKGIDLKENIRYQQTLLSKLDTINIIRVTTEVGTDISFFARNWVTHSGEVFCTPIEKHSNGTIVVDGCIFTGPPREFVKLVVVNGKVVNVNCLQENDEQQNMLKRSFLTDNNSTVLSEIGIGTNKNALFTGELMESEQARKTCHFGFGHNIEYGGIIENKNHFDLVVLNPTITINGKLIYDRGNLIED